jgi:signal transduction histidine kinase/ligand-binding sensor domain-containing protein
MQKTIAILLVLLTSALCLHAWKPPAFGITHFTNENGLPQSSVRDVELDKNGFLWIATEGGLARFDGQKFRLYDREHYPVMVSNRIVKVKRTLDGDMCFLDEHRNAYIFDQHYQPVRISKQRFRTLTNPPGLLFLRVSDFQQVSLVRAEDEHVFWTKKIPDIYLDPGGLYAFVEGKLYYWSVLGGIKAVDQQGNVHELKLKGAINEVAHGKVDRTRQRLINHNGMLYLWDDTKIYQVNISAKDELTSTTALTINKIRRVEIYREYPELNLKVVGSVTHGLYLFKKKDFQVATNNTGYQNFYAQAVFQDSGVVTHNGIIFPSSSYFNPLIQSGDAYRCLLLDSRKHYWINAVYGLGHYILELDSALRLIRKIPVDGEGVGGFVETPGGQFWFSSFMGNRIGMLNGDSINWLNTPLSQKSILTFLAESNDIFWIGGYQTLARLNVKTGTQHHFKALESYIIERLYFDHQKVLWIGTTGNGFFALKNDKIYRFPLDKNGYLKNTHSFLEDKGGFMWMSTNNGLFRCKKADLLSYMDKKTSSVYYQYFSKESGFNTNEFNGNCNPSAVIFKDGRFSLPSLDGLVQFYPDSIGKESPAYNAFIDKLSVDGKDLPLGQSLTLSPSFKFLEVSLSAPFYGHPDNQVLEYNLSGFDNNWYRVRKDNIIALNTLTYGNYILRLRKKSDFTGGYNEVVTAFLPFTVKPFFYQTWLFKLGLLAIILSGIWLLIKVRYAYLMRKNKELEEEVNTRTVSLRNANRLKEKMLLMVSHDLQSPLHFLGYLSQLNYDALQVKKNDKASEISLEIKNTSHKISSFVEEFKLWARVQDETFKLRSEKIPLRPLLEELLTFFKELVELNSNVMLLDVADGIEVLTNRPLLKAVLRNILDNANKNTRNGTITISCFIDPGNEGCIMIADTGAGMSSEELQKVERIVATMYEGISVEPDSSLGFQFIVDFTSRIKAALEIQSSKGKGTVISIKNLNMAGAIVPVPRT